MFFQGVCTNRNLSDDTWLMERLQQKVQQTRDSENERQLEDKEGQPARNEPPKLYKYTKYWKLYTEKKETGEQQDLDLRTSNIKM